LRDPLSVTTFDDAHIDIEERWITVGRAVTGGCLVVVHTCFGALQNLPTGALQK
jgi:uncharacterized DUF497 family protein